MKQLFLLVATLFIYACSSANKAQNEFIIHDIVNTSEPITLEDIKGEMTFIKLQMPDSSFISEINKVVFSDSTFYVLTYNPIKVLQFNARGEFLKQISAPGRGEGEYTYANDLFLNKEANLLYLTDMAGGILEFDHNGTFLKRNSCSQGIKSSIIGSDGNIYESIQVFMGNEPDKLIVRSVENDTIAIIPNHVKYKFNPQAASSYADSKSLFMLNDSIVYHQMSTDTVYTYYPEDKSLKIRYYFTNPYPMTAQVYEQLANKAKELTLVYDIAEDNHYIYATIITPPWQKQLYLIDKTTGKYYKANFEIGKDLGLATNVTFYPKWQNGKKLIDYIDTGASDPVVAVFEIK